MDNIQIISNQGDNFAFTFNGGNVGYRCDFYAYLYKWVDFNQEEIEPVKIDKGNLLKLQGDYITSWPNGKNIYLV